MKNENYELMDAAGSVPVKMWTGGVPVEKEAKAQLANTAKMPFIFKHIAVMPDVHLGKGSTIGSVIPTLGAIIPAAVGVDIGCGMMAAKTTLSAHDLPDNLRPLRSAIEQAIPHGMTFKTRGYKGRDEGSWQNPPSAVDAAWAQLKDEFDVICQKTPKLKNTNNYRHLGTLGSVSLNVKEKHEKLSTLCNMRRLETLSSYADVRQYDQQELAVTAHQLNTLHRIRNSTASRGRRTSLCHPVPDLLQTPP